MKIFPALLLILLLSASACASVEKTTMYFFWGATCPHCREMEPFIEKLGNKYLQLEIKSLEVFRNQENLALMENLSEAYNTTINSVPDVIIGGEIVRGYSGTKTEKIIEELITNCTRTGCKSPDQILLEYKSRPKPTTTTTTTSTTTTTTTTSTTSTSTTTTSTSTTTEPTTTTTTTTQPSTTTTNAKPDDAINTVTSPWIFGPIGIMLILLVYGFIAKNKKGPIKSTPKEGENKGR